MDSELQTALEVARRLARQAGEVVAGYFRSGLEVQRKAGDEPVTQADRESQAVILQGLREQFPDYGLLAEEAEDKRSWASHRRAWVVDPLDGTQDFVSGREGFVVMIGLLQDARPVLGVVHDPIRLLTYTAWQGGGAFLIEEATADRKERRTALQVSTRGQPAELRLISSRSHRSQRIDEFKRLTGISDEIQLGSVGLKVGLIARGERDVYLHPSGHSSHWDTCAPEVILHEAGGQMTDVHGRPLRYTPEELHQLDGILASNGRCHQAMVAALQGMTGS